MIELRRDELIFSFPEVHPDATLSVQFQRTLRIPDDGSDYPLPPGLGAFPLRHVDDFAARLPDPWKKPWLDGYCVESGTIRQFVAMPLGRGYTVEEQIKGTAEHGGLQIVAYPMKAEAYHALHGQGAATDRGMVSFCESEMAMAGPGEMGLAPGGRMKQEIYDDPHAFDVWDTRAGGRCFVHLANSLAWRMVTGEEPPTTPLTASEYSAAGMPWFDVYGGDRVALAGADKLVKLESVQAMGEERSEHPLPENETVVAPVVIELGGETRPVREGGF